jgi:hypothetical protein
MRCTVRRCPAKPRQKRPRNTRHCKSLSSLSLSFCCFYLKPNCQPARRVPTRPESKQRNTRLQKSHSERGLTAKPPILFVCRSDYHPSASIGHPNTNASSDTTVMNISCNPLRCCSWGWIYRTKVNDRGLPESGELKVDAIGSPPGRIKIIQSFGDSIAAIFGPLHRR